MSYSKKVKELHEKYLFKLVHIKQMLTGARFKQIYYSQFGEDIALQKLLQKRKGFYVDIGAFHPLHYSNTYLLHKRGWRGINVDPNSESIALFEKYRADDTNVCAGVSEVEEKQPYFVYNHQSCNTFSKDQVEKNKNKKFLTLLREEEVVCKPLSKILDEHVPEGVHVDLLTVDVEGMDLEVLKTNDWEKHAPNVVVVEIDVDALQKLTTSSVHKYLEDRGYKLVSWMGASAIYSHLPHDVGM